MAEQSSWSREGARLLSQEHKVRLVLTVVVALLVVAAGQPHLSDPRAAYLGLLLMGAALLLSMFGIREGRLASAEQFHLSAVALAVLDLVSVTLLLRGTGGANSGFFSLYLISLIFAAVFFRGLEQALLTIIAVLLYVLASWANLGEFGGAMHVGARLIGLIVVAWYAYALAEVLRREKEARDQLLRHLTEGVFVFDATQRVTLVNATMLALLGGRDESEAMGRTRAALTETDALLAWIAGDVGTSTTPGDHTTRVGCFPEAGLPLLECTTITCGADKKLDGWIVVCRDLRSQALDNRGARQSAFERLAPLTNLRALSQAMYNMAEYLEEDARWHAVQDIQEHTKALQGLLANMLQDTFSVEDEESLELSLVEVPALLQGTRRLLEIAPSGSDVPVEILVQDGLPEISADRAALGQSILQMCRGLVAMARPDDRLVIDVRSGGDGEKIVFTIQLVSTATRSGAEGEAAASCATFESMEAFEVIAQHEGSLQCTPAAGGVRRLVFDLPVEGPRKALEETAERAASRRELAEIAAEHMQLDPALAAEVSNELKNALNVIRGYAELALDGKNEDRRDRALRLAIDLSDQASELVDSLQPAGGQFPQEPPAAADVAEVCEVREEAPVARVSAGTILVVDDDSFMRQLLMDMLEDAGYETAGAEDGCQAIEYMQAGRPAMIFVDLAMPRVTGVDVLKDAKLRYPDLAVVLMTGYAYNLAMQALGDEKPYAVIGKPFAIQQVLSLAKAIVGEGKA